MSRELPTRSPKGDDTVTDREFSGRVTTRVSPRALKQIEALAVLRGVSVSSCIRSMLDHFLANDGGKSAEAERLRRILQRKPLRARKASRFRPDAPSEPPTRA